jgi:hypothetical protein
MPIIEANLVGRPVVTGNVATMPEIAGDPACLVDPFDVTSTRAGIQKVIEDSDCREPTRSRRLRKRAAVQPEWHDCAV